MIRDGEKYWEGFSWQALNHIYGTRSKYFGGTLKNGKYGQGTGVEYRYALFFSADDILHEGRSALRAANALFGRQKEPSQGLFNLRARTERNGLEGNIENESRILDYNLENSR